MLEKCGMYVMIRSSLRSEARLRAYEALSPWITQFAGFRGQKRCFCPEIVQHDKVPQVSDSTLVPDYSVFKTIAFVNRVAPPPQGPTSA